VKFTNPVADTFEDDSDAGEIERERSEDDDGTLSPSKRGTE
jgi:hypothetical protein